MAVNGVSRSTLNIDLLVIDALVLQSQTRAPPIDLIVGHGGWQAEILARPVNEMMPLIVRLSAGP